MASKIRLSATQKKVVESPWQGKVNLILATAGSGKTLSLTWRTFRIARELVQKGSFNARLLCVCFNKSAADEMAEELIQIIRTEHMSESIAITRSSYCSKDMVTVEVRTFHSLGFWILRSASASERQTVGLREGKLTLLTPKDVRSKLGEALRESGEIEPGLHQKHVNNYSRQLERPLNAYKRKLCDWECMQLLSQGPKSNEPARTGFVYEKSGPSSPRPTSLKPTTRTCECYQQRLNECNAIDFDDMISKAVRLATSNQQVRSRISSRFTAVLVDEFQDLTPSEFMLCKILVEKTKSLTFVGDDDQQIYSFRSSRTWFAHELLQSWFSDELITLQLPENRRCPGAVVKAAFAVIRHNSRRSPKGIIPSNPDGAPVRIFAFRSPELEANFIIGRIRALLPHVKATKERILVLFRTNQLLQQFQNTMKDSKIATSRVITDYGRTDTIAEKTSACFALITLMSQKIDRNTFIWAAVTVSPQLERSSIERILLTDAFCSSLEPQSLVPKTSENDIREMSHSDSKQKSESSSPPLLERLSLWFAYENENNLDFCRSNSYKPLRTLLNRAEQLKYRLRHLEAASDLVRVASEILTSNESGEFDICPEPDGSQGFPNTSFLIESRAGYELITSAAEKIDEEEANEDRYENTLTSRTKIESGVNDMGGDDEEDFASMFATDKQRRSRKRQKLVPKSATISEGRARIQKKIQRLCSILDTALTRSDVKQHRKVSRTERPPTVLSTVHKAKGATFSHVFLCGADTFSFPINGEHEIKASFSISLDSDQSQEERRTFFVALTRTRKEFVCTYSFLADLGSQDIARSQSPFLEEMKRGIGPSGFLSEIFVETPDDVKNALQTFG